jgi:ribonuclease Z
MKLTLLGTGSPRPDPKRRGPSQVVEVGDDLILVDCGSGALHRLVEAGYSFGAGEPGRHVPLRRIALTHLHSDHITGLPDLLWTGWILQWWDTPPLVVGPPGTARFIERLMDAFSYDISVRTKVEHNGLGRLVPEVEEIEEDWHETGAGWRLSAFRVDHHPVDQAFGFRLDGDAGSLVISGDTCECDNVVRHAEGAEVLLHEVYSRQGMATRFDRATDPLARARLAGIMSYHTPSDRVGHIASRAGAKSLVLSHLVLGTGGTPEDIAADASAAYDGPVMVGSDLQSISIGTNGEE